MSTPKLSELYTSILTDLRNRLSIKIILGRVFLVAQSMVQAGKIKLIYLQNAFVYKNIFPDTADPEDLGGSLERFGVVKLGRLPEPATAGEYLIQVTGEIGATIAPSSTFKSLDTSTSPDKLFILDNTFTFITTTGQIQLRALDLGTEARLEVDDQLQVTQPIANVDSFAVVLDVVTTPLEAESIEEYRQKVIQAYREEPQGGAKTDYRSWSQDAQGVRTSYPYVNEPGIIDLYVEANPDDSTDENGTPSQAILDDVEEVVEFDPDITLPISDRGRRPMGTFQINFLPINTLPVDVEITDLFPPDPSLLISIADAIEAYLFNIRPFIDGLDNPNESNKDLLYESEIYGVVRSVIGTDATFLSLTVEVSSTPINIYEFTGGDIPYKNSVINV